MILSELNFWNNWLISKTSGSASEMGVNRLTVCAVVLAMTMAAADAAMTEDMAACSISTSGGNVSIEWLQFYGNVSHWEFNNTPAVLTVSLCKPLTTACSGASAAYIQIMPFDAGCAGADVFSVVATPLAFSDGTATLQFISATYLANLFIACAPHVHGLAPDSSQESFVDGLTYNIFLASRDVCPGYSGGSGGSGNGSSDSGSDKLTRSETAGIVVGIFLVVLVVSIVIVRVRARARGAGDADYARIS